MKINKFAKVIFFLKNLFNHLHMFKEIYYKRNRSDYKERCRAKNSFALQMNIKMSSHAQNNLIQNESFATKKNHQRNFIIWNLQRFNIVSYLKYAGPTICFPCSYTIENNLKSNPPELNEMKALYKNFIKFYMNNCSQTLLWHLVCHYM